MLGGAGWSTHMISFYIRHDDRHDDDDDSRDE
jgi:hypothetical protein